MKHRYLLPLLIALSSLTGRVDAGLKVASLHPIVGDLVKQVGGDHVEVVQVLKPGTDLHHFSPSAKDIAAMRGATIVFASGKGMESYLDKLRDSLGGGVTLIEVGRTVPSIKISADQSIFMCCPEHARGGIDPHWWQSSDNMKRAAGVVADALTAGDPANKAAYEAGAESARQRISAVKAYAQKQLSQIPRSDRKLVTAHAAFGYFCKEYGFKTIPVLGLSAEGAASVRYTSEVVKAIQTNKIRAVFPETGANPKVLSEIARQTGVKVGRELNGDGTTAEASTFESMTRHNVDAIVAALKP